MIKLKSLLKENSTAKYFWMDPNGKLLKVFKRHGWSAGHADTAHNILQTIIGKDPEKDIFKQMYNLGWVRIAFVGEGNYYTLSFNSGFDRKPSARQLSALKDLAIELRADEIRNNSTNERYSDF